MNITEKLIKSHLVSGEMIPGKEIAIKIDQTLTLDSFPAQIYDPMMESENGFAIDLMNQLAWEMDTTIEFQPVIWADSFTLLENGTVDMIQISYSEERAEKYYLSAPIYRSKGVVFFAR